MKNGKLIVYNVSKKYHRVVLSHFSYVFEKNKIFGITGPSGCGKSTLLSILSLNIKKFYGEVYYNNVSIKKQKNYPFLNVSYVNQSNLLIDHLTAYENVILPLKVLNVNTSSIHSRVITLFKRFKVDKVINEKVKNLSGGEKQRIVLIRSFIKDSDILLLDEPTSALDEKMTDELFNYLNEIKEKKIIIMVTHNIALANKCDELITFPSPKEKKENITISSHYKKEKIKFKKSYYLYKKVFIGKKILNNISTSILSLGLVGICLNSILSSFIQKVSKQSLETFNIENSITVKDNHDDIDVDIKKIIKTNFNAIYYEGINAKQKKFLKEEKFIEKVYFNNSLVNDINFIYDNYLSTFPNYLTLAIPEKYLNSYVAKNKLYYYCNNKEFIINIDDVILSNDDNFYIFCNDFSYLFTLYKAIGLEYEALQYIYSEDSKQIYEYLLFDDKFNYYSFYHDESSNVIMIVKENMPRINLKQIDEFVLKYNYDYYIICDNIHTYIDYNSGFSYLLFSDYSAIQVVIDNSLAKNNINISRKYYSLVNDLDDTFYYEDKNFKINEIIDEDNYSIIYMSSETFNSLSSNLYYCALIHFSSKYDSYYDESFLINTSLFQLDSFLVFDYICNFLFVFSIILIIDAIIASIYIFTMNFIMKKKDIKVLMVLGIYPSYIVKILLYDPFINIMTSILSSFIITFLSKYFIEFFYIYIKHQQLTLSINYIALFFSILSPLIIFLLIILIKLFSFIKTNFLHI
ncbi:MAG: ABC transporter ATP-binding protein [Erysipelotrichaceae bacterium]|nr:ABC transporter ATP-binding protein [Erysipelotrichaceae bacterium]